MNELAAGSASEGWRLLRRCAGLAPGRADNVLSMIRLSWRGLAARHDSAGSERSSSGDGVLVMKCLALLAPDPTPVKVLRRIPPFDGDEGAEDLQIALDELEALSLAQRVGAEGETGTVVAHRAVLAYVREFEVEDIDALLDDVSSAVRAELASIHENLFERLPEFALLQPHAVVVAGNEVVGADRRCALAIYLALGSFGIGRFHQNNGMLMVSISGTAVIVE